MKFRTFLFYQTNEEINMSLNSDLGKQIYDIF